MSRDAKAKVLQFYEGWRVRERHHGKSDPPSSDLDGESEAPMGANHGCIRYPARRCLLPVARYE
jgi:hypothetical protein